MKSSVEYVIRDSYVLAVGRVLLHLLWRLFSLCVLLAGLLLLGIYVGFAALEHYHPKLQGWLSQALQQPVKLQSVRTEWQAWTPVLHLGMSQIGSDNAGKGVAGFKQAQLRLDLIASLLQGQVITQNIEIDGGYFTLNREADRQLRLSGVPASSDSFAKPSAAAHFHRLLHWFLQQDRIQLHNASLVWQSATQPAPVRFNAVELQLQRQGGAEYSVEGSLQLPLQAYAPPTAAGLGLYAQGGQVSFRTRTQWNAQRLQRLQGHLQVRDLQLAASRTELVLPQVAADILWQPVGAVGWHMQVDNFSFATSEAQWPPSQMELLATPLPNAAQGLQLQGQIGFLRLQELAPLLSSLTSLPPSLRTALSATQPHAELHSTHFLLQPDDWEVRTHFQQASSRPWQALPGVQNVSGVLNITPKVGSLTLNSQDAQIKLSMIFADPIKLQHLQGSLTWQRWQSGWLLHTSDLQAGNADADTLSLRGSLKIPLDDTAPQADVQILGQQIALTSLERYVPLNAPETRHWMRDGLLDGVLSRAEIRLSGPLDRHHLLRQAPGQNGLQGHAQIQDARINYASGWTPLEAVQGRLDIDGDTLRITGQQGRLMHHQIQDTQVTLHNLDRLPHYLTLHGQTQGAAADALAFITASPLNINLSTLSLSGPVRLDLDMRIPLSPGTGYTRGTVHFSDSSLSTPRLEKLGLPLEHLRGDLQFSDASLQAKNFSAQLLGSPVRFSLQRRAAEQAQAAAEQGILVKLQGSANQGFLHALFKRLLPELVPWTHTYSGAADWQAQLQILDQEKQNGQLIVTSDLQGAALALPAPLGKIANSRRPLRLSTSLNNAAPSVLSYSDALQLAYQGEAVALHFGAAPAVLKPQAGWRISGDLDRLDVSAWQHSYCLAHACNTTGSEPASATSVQPGLEQVRTLLHNRALLLDVKIAQVSGDTPLLHQVQAQGYAHAERGLLYLSAAETQGEISYTQNPPQVNVQLSRLHLPSAEEEHPTDSPTETQMPGDYIEAMQRLSQQSNSLDPRTLPPLLLYCKSLKIGEIDLGLLELQAQPEHEGFALKNLNLHGSSLNATATGLWSYRKHSGLSTQADTQTSELDLFLSAEDFAQAMAQLGQPDSAIHGGQPSVHFNGDWPGNPWQFHESHVRGRLQIAIGKGQLVAVEMGPVGRLVGLLDLRSLSHRLALDFRDVFEKGLGFNSIKGEFFIEGGHAYTDGIQLKGPIADIEIAGRTGLLNHTYEQDVLVMPHIGNALPVAGAVAGGPAVGLTVLVLQNLFKNDLKDTVKYHYRISGPWNNPQVLLLEPLENEH